jgi:hypothetical protein
MVVFFLSDVILFSQMPSVCLVRAELRQRQLANIFSTLLSTAYQRLLVRFRATTNIAGRRGKDVTVS